MEVGNKRKNYCTDCYRFTNHSVIAFKKVDGSDDYHQSNFYCIVECDGCNNCSYRTEYVDYEEMIPDDDGSWRPSISIDMYPKVLQLHQELGEISFLPKEIQIVYKETIRAFSAKCYLLTAVGFRSIIEAICKDKSIVAKDLSIQINKMSKNGLITQKEADRLHAVRFLGNDSVHEMAVPKPQQLMAVLNIIEHLLKNLYLIDNELKANLETVFQSFSQFKNFLGSISKLKIGDIMSLRSILGKSSRRLSLKASDLEKELIEKIKMGEYKYLKVGEIKQNHNGSKEAIQYYEVVENNIDFDDLL